MEILTNLLNGAGATAGSMSGMEMGLNALIVLAGIVVHFIKKCKIEKVSMWHYWRDKPKSSMMSLMGAVVGYAILMKTGETSAIALFSSGYLADSLLNRFGVSIPEDDK